MKAKRLGSWSVRAGVVVLALGFVACEPKAAPPALRVLAGPMPGWSGHREVEIWVMVEGERRPALVYHPQGQEQARVSVTPSTVELVRGGAILRYHPALLDPGTIYAGTLEGATESFRFQTQADWPYKVDPPPFSFILGSCLYLNDEPYDRPGSPYGQGDGVLKHMAGSGADFMLWLGDNTYLRPADWTSPAGIHYRHQREKSHPDIRSFWSAMHHFAIWDDHDYGPNDSSKSFPLRDTARSAFRQYWANPPSGLPEHAGIMSTFVWSDSLFVLLDNRSNRDANNLDVASHPHKTQLGAAQIEWLEQTLLSHPRAPFKFIALGGQFLKDHNYESFGDFPEDRRRILEFIQRHKIEGVVFLSGDRHFTELRRVERKGAYPLYELTSSPIGSGIAQRALEEEKNDPGRIPGTLVDTQNFCRIEVSGPRDDRVLVLSSIDKTGTERWRRELRASELKASTR